MERGTHNLRRIALPLCLAIGLASTSVLATGCSLFGTTTTTTKTTKTTTATVTKGNLQVGLIADGRVVLSTADQNFEVAATVSKIDVVAGQTVKKGDTLAELDSSTLQRAEVTAQNGLDRATAAYNDSVIQRKINLLTEKIALANAKAKYVANPSDALTAANYELETERYDNLLNYDVSVITAKLNMEDAQTALDSAKADLSKTVLTASIDGVVSAINYKVGDQVTAVRVGFNGTTTAFITLIDPTVVYVTASVTEGDINGVKIGQAMKISIDAASLSNVDGTVTDVSNSPSVASTGIVTYTVTGTLANPDVPVLQSMSCVITFIKQEKDSVLLIPVKAVSTSSEGIQTVNVKKADGTIESRTVTTGLTNGVSVEVVSGLSEGETVVIGSLSK